MYICCQMCPKWYHAAALELEESEIFEVVGFKCCRCGRVKLLVCPYSDPDSNAMVTAKGFLTAPMMENSKVEGDYGIISGQYMELDSDSLVLPENEGIFCATEEDSLLFSLSSDQQYREHNPEMDFEWNTTTTAAASGNGPHKLPIGRHMKPERNGEHPTRVELSTPIEPNNLFNPGDESFSPKLEWDVSENGFLEDGVAFDWEGPNFEDMEFEPQTYFSFTELLASDGGGQVGQVDASGDIMAMNY